MKRVLLAMALPLALGLSACEPEPCTVFTEPPANRPGLFLLNEQVRIPLHPLVHDACGDQASVMPEGISAEVYDPDQLPVEHQASMNHGEGTLQFTPTKLGRYHIFAAFEPVGGIHQFGVYTAMDRSAESPVHTLNKECTSLQRTRSGAFVCDLELYRQGAPVLQLPSGRLAVSGDVVWQVDAAEVARYVDTGTRLERIATLAHTSGAAEAILATETELVVLHANRIQRFLFNGQTLTRTGESLWDPPFENLRWDGPRGVMVRTGDRLAVISSVVSTEGARLQLCPFQLDQGRFLRTREACEQMPGVVLGFEPSVLWLGEEPPNSFSLQSVHRLEWTGTQWLKRGSLDLGTVLRLPILINPNLRRTEVVPVFESPQANSMGAFRTAVPVYVPGQPQLRLDFLDGNVTRPQASPTLFWGISLVSTAHTNSRVRLRPATP
ncbi:MAG TPA: hypothetical protein VF815_28850 [Myxococcaceae bacterium]|jgi:hypothetical protein